MASTPRKGSKPSRKQIQELQMLTKNDSKVLGKTLDRKREKTVPPAKFKTSLYKTHNSNWTPLAHRATNEQIYKERRELIINWFDLWSDSQRRRFLDLLFRQCRKNQFYFIQNWFNERVPLRHLDFTTVLPKFLSLYIFSFLDPRSLCRASQVSWHWKFLSEQDQLWQPKALRLGWFLPYTPEENEYGAWKRHYVACIKTLDMEVPSKEASELYGSLADGTRARLLIKLAKEQEMKRKKLVLHPDISDEILKTRPPWQGPDHKPKDLQLAGDAVKYGFNPNDPDLPPNYLKFFDKFGTTKKQARIFNDKALVEYGLITSDRKSKHRAFTAEDVVFPTQTAGQPLSRSLDLESFTERRLMELVHQEWEPPVPEKKPGRKGPNLAGGGAYPLPWSQGMRQPISKSYPSQEHPRVIFISSRVPAADILVDAVNFGVIPLVYEYEGTTLESLMSRLDGALQGRNAQSVGLFVHSNIPGELCLVHSATVTLDTLDHADFVEFFQTVANYILPEDQQGHFDVFVPLASTEPGNEMLNQLRILTGTCFTSPTGLIGNYNHVNSEWLKSPENTSPPSHYFCSSKLNVWANTADQVQEAIKVTHKVVAKHFEEIHRDLVSQVTGQIIFDATGQADIQGIPEICEGLTEALLALPNAQNVPPLEFIGKYLLEKAGHSRLELGALSQTKKPGQTLSPAKTMKAETLSQQLSLNEKFEDTLMNSDVTQSEEDFQADTEVAGINGKPSKNKEPKDNKDTYEDEVFEEEIEEDIQEDIEEIVDTELDKDKKKDAHDETDGKEDGNEKEDKRISRSQSETEDRRGVTIQMQKTLMMQSTADMTESTWPSGMHRQDSQYLSQRIPGGATAQHPKLLSSRRLTSKQFNENPEKRTMIAKEILASEVSYRRMLEILRDVYFIPLRNSLASNRGIVSAHNLQIIFSDVMTLLDLSKDLSEDLKNRVADWGPAQCLGDIFVKFNGKLKPYINFLKNYAIILQAIERCLEQTPAFRAFLKRHDRQPNTKMLTIQELLLTPTRRINEYVHLLTWLQTYTPADHADRMDLEKAISTLTELDTLLRDTKERLENEKELVAIQKQILSCPALMEGNRFLIKRIDMAHLRPPSEAVSPELRTYQHIEMIGLFLFNDALVVTRRTTRHTPFERSVQHIYKFETCTSLNRLRIDDIPDSKYVKNAFRMYTPRRSWVCAADTFDDKFNWVTLVEQTIRTVLDLD